MATCFEIIRARGDKFAFRLRAANGEVILASQTYTSKTSCKRGVASVQANAKLARHYDRKKSKNGKDFFNLLARNKKVIGTSEMYNSPRAMEGGIASVKKNGRTRVVVDKTSARK